MNFTTDEYINISYNNVRYICCTSHWTKKFVQFIKNFSPTTLKLSNPTQVYLASNNFLNLIGLLFAKTIHHPVHFFHLRIININICDIRIIYDSASQISLRARGHKSQQRRDTARTHPHAACTPTWPPLPPCPRKIGPAPACNFAINLSRRALMHRKCLVSPLFAPLVSRCKFIRLVVLQRRSIGHVFSH